MAEEIEISKELGTHTYRLTSAQKVRNPFPACHQYIYGPCVVTITRYPNGEVLGSFHCVLEDADLER